jgi:hypothetical protein
MSSQISKVYMEFWVEVKVRGLGCTPSHPGFFLVRFIKQKILHSNSTWTMAIMIMIFKINTKIKSSAKETFLEECIGGREQMLLASMKW